MPKSKLSSVQQIWSNSRLDPPGSNAGTPNIAIASRWQPEAPVGQPRYVPTGLSVKPNVPPAAIGVVPQVLPSVTQYAAAPLSKSSSAWHVTSPANSKFEARAVSVLPRLPDTSYR